MVINRHNYEEYLLDFMEGNLPAHEVDAVLLFLEENPDIKSEFEGIEESVIPIEESKFTAKDSLKKDLSHDIEGITRFEQLSVACLEKDISKDELIELNVIINKSEHKALEHQTIQSLKIIPDSDVKYPYKRQLKHYQLPKFRFLAIATMSVAASAAALIGLSILLRTENVQRAVAVHAFDFHKENTRTIVIKENKGSNVDKTNTVLYAEVQENKVNNGVEKVQEIVNNQSVDLEELNLRTISHVGQQEDLLIQGIDIANITVQNTPTVNEDLETNDFVRKRLEELGINEYPKQSTRKSFIALAGKTAVNFLGGVFRRNVQIKKTEMEDGRRLYAVRAGSYEFYANRPVKNKKAKESSKETN